MRLLRLAVILGSILGAGGMAHAGNSTVETPKRVAAALKVGLAKGTEVAEAFERAAALATKVSAKKMQPVLKAMARAFKRDKKGYQLLALKTYAKMAVPGSYTHFAKQLDLPDKVVGIETRAVRIRAITTAGELHEEAALGDLEALLTHPDIAFSRAAANALAAYVALPEDKRGKLVQRLVKRLASLEKQTRDRKAAIAKAATTLISLLNPTIETLAGVTGPKTAAAWKKQLDAK